MAETHKGKIALVTGANKGIGFEVALQLGTEGVTVLVGARDPQLGESAAAKLKAAGADAYFLEQVGPKSHATRTAADWLNRHLDALQPEFV